MRRLSKDSEEELNKTPKVLIAVVVTIFLISLLLSIWLLKPSDNQLVEIVSDGEVLYSIDLSKEKDTEFTIEYNGSSNTIQIQNGEIWVQEAQCPDQTCVNMGKLHSESMPIICLPNRLIIRFAE